MKVQVRYLNMICAEVLQSYVGLLCIQGSWHAPPNMHTSHTQKQTSAHG